MQTRQANSSGPPVVRRWSRHPRSVGCARAELLTTLDGWGLSEVADSAAVVLSELVTNAVRHAHVSPGREIETRYLRVGDGVRIEVHDAAEQRPGRATPSAEAEHGRGLFIVDALSECWGVSERDGAGKSVWAVVTVSGRERWL
ncbi:ATP-binding protein [Streptomyces sp. H10-C2]|uniref:ATP-binding protein n=1 Tax=unclassified Streptomyces TaxID=2593676 RepID=UPI0024B9581A|nr:MULTISPECIES: ATP-binding protein [unclassified Streptomyces]MDJ0347663.1 ATP-binding protein [Streptomyces sp. PH10-H1]MDJ0375829.1 ATP-binding protein [Streptomyces sp. H10-C2]